MLSIYASKVLGMPERYIAVSLIIDVDPCMLLSVAMSGWEL